LKRRGAAWEDKIAQLNETIDEVRLTLGDVNQRKSAEGTQGDRSLEVPKASWQC